MTGSVCEYLPSVNSSVQGFGSSLLIASTAAALLSSCGESSFSPPAEAGSEFIVSEGEDGLVRTDVGCVDDLDAETLDAAFAEPIGPLIGWDNPHVYELGDDRWLWLVHDSYFDYTGEAADLHHDGPQIQNLAILQTGTCFQTLFRGTTSERVNFETGVEQGSSDRFLWPLGGERHGDSLWVFWSETVNSDPPPPYGNGIARHPERVWLAEYDAETLVRRSFQPAPNDGVFPSYGFAVASDSDHSYLFGNSNLLNFDREGGFYAGPHSATRTYLARVPRGEFDKDPTYWDGDGWASSPDRASVISERFFTENTMQPRYLDGQWLSVAKEDGFYGSDLVIDVADEPSGPWRTVQQFEYPTRDATVEKNSYQPVILPWSSPTRGLAVVISENAMTWSDAVADPDLYRPSVVGLEWPSP